MNVKFQFEKSQRNFLLFIFLFLNLNMLFSQRVDWELDRHKQQVVKQQLKQDSLLLHLENTWEIKLSYGKWFFSNSAKTQEEESEPAPGTLNAWQVSGIWHFKEALALEFSIGFQLKKDIPASLNISSILNGDEIEVEGSGFAFLPVDIGMKYYLNQKRFRPYIGGNLGTVRATSRYILAEGNINNGITRTESKDKAGAVIGKVNTGIDYRIGVKSIFSVNTYYSFSSSFEKTIGGYMNYQGLGISTGFSLVF